jgi:hypothetical protein
MWRSSRLVLTMGVLGRTVANGVAGSSTLREHSRLGYVRQGVGLNEARPYSRARVFDGCSARNQCAGLWPFRQDFDQWAKRDLPGWSFDDLRPLIRKVNQEVPISPHGGVQLGTWQQHFLAAARGAGYPRLGDLSSPEPAIGVMLFLSRCSTRVRDQIGRARSL